MKFPNVFIKIMHIAIDYDGTYTLDPYFWDNFKEMVALRGHVVSIITKRGVDHKGLLDMPEWQVIHTNLQAKQERCKDLGLHVDVWIDDDPINIISSGKVTSK